jgi:hypothetical protein
MSRKLEDAVQELLDKQEITEVLLRFCRGCDRFDLQLLESVYWPEATDDHGAYVGSAITFAKSVCETQSIYDGLSHKISPPFIKLSGDTAEVETYFLCMVIHNERYEMGPANYMIGGRYLDLFERREGVWRILNRVVIWDWNLKNGVKSDWGHMNVPKDGKYGGPMAIDPSYFPWPEKKGDCSTSYDE